ncbi:hypothetical protein JM79_3198 [Gramella sp. Hel_I_59]|nr:hypothetical protein JM79_3198 [Gramella sp. Hel_I_59]
MVVIERDARWLKKEIHRIKQNIKVVGNSLYSAEEKATLLQIYVKQLRKNEQELASFSINQNQ